MRSLKIENLKARIDAIELALDLINLTRDNGQLTFQFASEAIIELQMIRVDLLLEERNAIRDIPAPMPSDRLMNYARNNVWGR